MRPKTFDNQIDDNNFYLFEDKSFGSISEDDPMYNVVKYTELEQSIASIFGVNTPGSIFSYNNSYYNESKDIFELVYNVDADCFVTLVKDHLKTLNPKFNSWASLARKVFMDGEYKGVVGFMQDSDAIYSAINYSYAFPVKLTFSIDLGNSLINVKLANNAGQDYIDLTLEDREELNQVRDRIYNLIGSDKYIYPHFATELSFIESFDELERRMLKS